MKSKKSALAGAKPVKLKNGKAGGVAPANYVLIAVATLRATPKVKAVAATGWVGGYLAAESSAGDSGVDNVPSVAATSFTLVVPPGIVWEVRSKQAASVSVFSYLV